MTPPRKKEALTDQLVHAMRQRIAGGGFQPGDKLPTEQALIQEFGVSRTVVREALANLKALGIVSTQQGIGAFVLHCAPPDSFRLDEGSLSPIHETVAMLEVRIALETETSALAALRRSDTDLDAIVRAHGLMESAIAEEGDGVEADLAFHSAVAAATGNRHFVALFDYLGAMLIPRARLQAFRLHEGSHTAYLETLLGEHEGIVRAIRQRDPDAARAAMRLHLGSSRDRLRSQSAN